ncbi:MAG TPA: translation elongation factor 4 [Thermodesulfovibrionales bacterium]|nr:translation elongation factor 4 [Thermodesulfovibrionales bacterium]
MSKNIRNFSIIAHIDHGKSTLADRLLEYTGALSKREMQAQVLDSMDLERERGITIKAHAVRLSYRADDGNEYILNLIDTPGHVDFSYEVSRSLASCEGALLIVDASQGVEAQTLANAYLAVEHNLEMIPVINKIDLPSADPARVKEQIEDAVGIDSTDAILTSAKEGIGTKEILETIVKKVPPPPGDERKPLKALIFDSWFDNYQGVIVLVRVFDGSVKAGSKILLMAKGTSFEVLQVGIFTPKMTPVEELTAGEVGYIIASLKNVADTKIGDTITDLNKPAAEPCPGYKDIKPMVFCGFYPTLTHQYENLRDALNKLRLNDSSFTFEPETSLALGFGFRCGFLGLLHMEIIQERLEREFDLSLLSTAPTVVYRVTLSDGSVVYVENPATLPDQYETIEEPFVLTTIFVPKDFIGPILDLCQEKRGVQRSFHFIGKDRIKVEYELPLNEILWDF